MPRYIDADRAKEDFNIYFGGVSHAVIAGRILDEQPTIEARPVVRGEWSISKRAAFSEECSACGGCVPLDEYGNRHGYNFCPNCGTEMRTTGGE